MIKEHGAWVRDEFGIADLGDKRRTERLVALTTALAKAPTASLPEAIATQAELTATYRFFDNANVEAQAILASHTKATQARLAQRPIVLAVQDTTTLDFTGRKGLADAGPLSGYHGQGFHVHTTLALTPERVPLGLLAQSVWARDAQHRKKAEQRKQRPIDEKESYKWLQSLQATIQTQAQCEQTHFISIGDREADIYDLFAMDRPEKVDLLVRAAQNRNVELADGTLTSLFKQVTAAPIIAHVTLQVPKRNPQPKRSATLAIRLCPLQLRPPRYRAKEALKNVAVWGIWATEEAPDPGREPLSWLLLSTYPIHTSQDAITALDWYACRWGIEVLHKVLKSGCRIEARQFATAARITRCLAVYSVIAWRILYATMLSRAFPEGPCTALLDADEWAALYCAIHEVPTPPAHPPSLRDAVRWIGHLGGFIKKKNRPDPGVTALWKGFQHLTDLTKMYRILKPPDRKM